ncbi:MAG: methyltransferase domain-containing protein [Hydrogenibacillus sp.]|nr:methyltransferase domain-containing protein [Hydrogenibacillus sp.]
MEYLELIALLGIDDAHPGGAAASEEMLAAMQSVAGLSPGARVLDVGCGTGASAVRLARAGYDVTAVDRDPRMVERTKLRLSGNKLTADVRQADTRCLPFPDGSFDVVWVESVALFVSDHALREWHRVLRPDGFVFDHELVAHTTMPPDLFKSFRRFYGISRAFDELGWIQAFENAGFRPVEIVRRFTLDDWLKAPPMPTFFEEGTPVPAPAAEGYEAETSGDELFADIPGLVEALQAHDALTWEALPHLRTAFIRACRR